jgi:hypothetical protein
MDRSRAAIVTLVILMGASAPTAGYAADAPMLRAEAGLGGLARPGRWVPVRISVDNDGSALQGELVVQWGDATVHRGVVLAAPSRSRFELYIRTPDVRDVITVRLQSKAIAVASIDVPVRVVPLENETTVCVTSAGAVAADLDECTSSVPTEALPRSMRGYDAADRLLWRAGPEAVLASDQRIALERWRQYRQLQDADVPSRAPRPPSAAEGTAFTPSLRALSAGFGLYVLAMVAAGVLTRTTRRRPLPMYAAITCVAVLGSSAALSAGRIGPASAVVVRHVSMLQELPRGGSLISMRAVAEFPSFDTFHLRAGVADSSLESKSTPRSDVWFDDAGLPLLSGVHALGSSEEFTLEGIVDFSPLQVERRPGVVRVTNTASVDLHDCGLSDGFSVQHLGTLAAGRTLETEERQAENTPFFTCELLALPVEFVEGTHPVKVEGTTVVAAYLAGQTGTR